MVSATRKLMQTSKNQMTEVQDRMGKKVKVSRHDKTLDGIKLLRKREVLQEKRSMSLSFGSE